MRLGTWLAANEIPDANMASQIDIAGGVHYYSKAVPGQRLARHALKNQYGKDIVADGPTRLYGKALPASAEPETLHVTWELDGKLMHERNVTNIVVGDVWCVSIQDAKWSRPAAEPVTGNVRMLTPFANKRTDAMPNRYKPCASGYPKSRYFAKWTPPKGFAKELGERIFEKTGKPVGIVVMNTMSDALFDNETPA